MNILPTPKQHHVRAELCTTRARYREGRQLKAVKVYTVNQESKYLLVQGIPAVGGHEDLVRMFASYGPLAEYKFLDDHAKRKLDDFNFYGGVLHVCYAPEYESIQETREKLQDRRKAVAARIRKLAEEEQASDGQPSSRRKSKSPKKSDDFNTKIEHMDTQSGQNVPAVISNTTQEASLDSVLHAPSYITNHVQSSQRPSSDNAPPWWNPGHQNYPTSVNVTYKPNITPVTTQTMTVYPCQDQDSYRGPLSNPPGVSDTKPTQKTVQLGKETVIVKPAQPKKLSTPKFVPRQVSRVKPVVTRSGKTLPENDKSGDSEESIPDPVNEKLRQESLQLGNLAGPELPEREAVKRKHFQTAGTTGDEAMEKTATEIRERLRKFCTVAIPPQVKKKRKK